MEITQQPFNKQAEESLLGSILLYPDCYYEIAKQIGQEDFYIARNQWIFEAIENCSKNSKTVDLLTVSDTLEKSGKLKDCGGTDYILMLINQTPSAMHAQEYANIVKDYSTRRKVIAQATKLAQAAFDTSKPIVDSIPDLSAGLFEAVKTTGGAEHISIGLAKLFDDIYEKVNDPKDVWGIPTGFPTLDKVMGGLQKGSTLALAGMPAVGKSLMAIQIGFSMSYQGHPGAIYELEMNQMMTLRRQLSVMAQVKSRAMKTGRLQEGDLDKIGETIERMNKLPVYLSNNTNWTTTTLRADLMTLKKLHGVEWFIIDYLKLVKDRFDGKEPERLGHVSTLLHSIAQDLDMGCIMVNSMTKEGMKDAIGITGMYGGAELDHSADFVLMLEPVDRENKPRRPDEPFRIQAKVAKDREGDTGITLINFVREANYPFFREESSLPF